MKQVTLQEVANNAGVSRATASLVLRGSPLVAEDTRENVLSVMRRLGYVYNRAAANLRARQTRTIGLAVSDITNPYFAELTVGIEDVLDQENFTVLLTNTAESAERQSRALEVMQGHRVDGILLCPGWDTPVETIERLDRSGVPFVLVTRSLPGVEAPYVGPDRTEGADIAVDHLLSLGHRRIAFLGGPIHSEARAEREEGYRRALHRSGLAVDPALSITSPITRAGGTEAVRQLLRQPEPATAALCYNDVVAFGVTLGLRMEGLEPGRDFGVVGFDDIADAATWQPPLTTVSNPPAEVGRAAVKLLLERMQRPGTAAKHILLPPRLEVRSSCGARRE